MTMTGLGQTVLSSRLTGSKRSLEAQLTPALHSIGLLKNAIKKEEDWLRGDKQRLDALQEDERSEERLRTKHMKRVRDTLISDHLIVGPWTETLLLIEAPPVDANTRRRRWPRSAHQPV